MFVSARLREIGGNVLNGYSSTYIYINISIELHRDIATNIHVDIYI